MISEVLSASDEPEAVRALRWLVWWFVMDLTELDARARDAGVVTDAPAFLLRQDQGEAEDCDLGLAQRATERKAKTA